MTVTQQEWSLRRPKEVSRLSDQPNGSSRELGEAVADGD
jgi:hypothetical protein